MKILLVASESIATSEVMSQALQVKFELPDIGSPFFVLRSTLKNENEMAPPNYLPFVLEAEFRKTASTHPLYNKAFHNISLEQNYDGAIKDIVGVVPTTTLGALDLKKRLEKHGFDVISCLIKYGKALNGDSFLSRNKNNELVDESNFYDVVEEGEKISALYNRVGQAVCDAHNIGLTATQVVKKELGFKRQPVSGNLLSNSSRFISLQSLKLAANTNSGKTELSRRGEFIDDYLSELKSNQAENFSDLPHSSKLFVLEKAYLQGLVNTPDMRNILQNTSLEVGDIVPDFSRFLGFADRLKLNIDKLSSAQSLPELSMVVDRIDKLLADERFFVSKQRYNLLPRTVELVIDEQAGKIMMDNGYVRTNDNANTVPYNPNFPASHALNEYLSSYRVPANMNITEQQNAQAMRLQ